MNEDEEENQAYSDPMVQKWWDVLSTVRDQRYAIRREMQRRWPLGSTVRFTERHTHTGTVASYESRATDGEDCGVKTPGVVVFVADDGHGEPFLVWLPFEDAVRYGLHVITMTANIGPKRKVKK